jgi:hypothetical protein
MVQVQYFASTEALNFMIYLFMEACEIRCNSPYKQQYSDYI